LIDCTALDHSVEFDQAQGREQMAGSTAVTDDVFAQIANAKASGGGTYINDGKYLHEVRRLILEKMHTGICFVAELIVREAEPVEVPDNMRKPDEIGKVINPNKVGAEVSIVFNMTKQDSAAGNAKALLLAIDGTPESEVDPVQFAAMIKKTCSREQPFRGALVRDVTFRKIIKGGPNAGKPFTGHKWATVEQTIAEIQARRAALDRADADKPATVNG
jgi:hypothetical protein